MTISQRTPTSGSFASGGSGTITLPIDTTDGDMLVVVVGNPGVTGPAAPTGWIRQYSASAGTSQCCSVFTAPYSASLTLTFVNATGIAPWVCNAYFEPGASITSIDGSPVAAISTTNDTTLPTGAPTTGDAAGDYEVLCYVWTSNANITGVASGSTIDRKQSVSTIISAAQGHNNSTSLTSNTTVTAFSQTLSAANTRKTGVGLLLVKPSTGPVLLTVATSQATSVGLARSTTLMRAISQSHTVALVRGIFLDRAVAHAQTVSLVIASGITATVSATQVQAVALGRAIQLKRGVIQPAVAVIARDVARLVTTTQATATALVRQSIFTRSITQAQAVTGTFAKGYQLIVAASQSMAVACQRLVHLTRATTGNRRVDTQVSIHPSTARTLRISRPTSVRLVRQIQLTRAVTQEQSAALAGVPVSLQVLAAIQTRSLALERAVSLVRGIVQATAAYLPTSPSFERTLRVVTVLARQQAVDLARAVEQSQAVSVEVLDVTPYYEILVTASVSQQLELVTTGTGASAKHFMVRDREAVFVANARSSTFTPAGRRVRFTAEVR